MSEHDVKEAFDAYRSEPGGEVRLDTAAITTAGRRRVRRNHLLIGAAGLGVAATLVGAAVVVPRLGDERGSVTVANPENLPPATGRDVDKLFARARGWQPDGGTERGGAAAAAAAKFLAGLGGAAPTNVDTAWQPEAGGTKAGPRWALITWADGDRAAEGLLTVDPNPVTIAIFPPPYQVCGEQETTGGSTCTVREVAGKGWLKEVSKDGQLRVSLQGSGPAVEFLLTQGAATSERLAGGRQPRGEYPVDAKTVGDAVLGTL
jgi:hypothetical protein